MVFYHPDRDVSLVVHGDDFTFCGMDKHLSWIEGEMKKWYEIKVRGRLWGDPDDDKEVKP